MRWQIAQVNGKKYQKYFLILYLWFCSYIRAINDRLFFQKKRAIEPEYLSQVLIGQMSSEQMSSSHLEMVRFMILNTILLFI